MGYILEAHTFIAWRLRVFRDVQRDMHIYLLPAPWEHKSQPNRLAHVDPSLQIFSFRYCHIYKQKLRVNSFLTIQYITTSAISPGVSPGRFISRIATGCYSRRRSAAGD